MKTRSIYFPPERLATIRQNASRYEWARRVADEAVSSAQHWLSLSLDDIWDIMFPPDITRSWFVWSSGHCPACRASMPMYTWKADALNTPWKLVCPHCGALFPTNDFAAYYRSGLTAAGRFDEVLADRSLLFNAAHPDCADPLHRFGVDGGHGFEQEGNRWWFIGAYLIWGQWKQLALGGVKALSQAYAVTGDRAYSRRAMVLLDRVADLLPGFSFLTQGIMYDVEPYVDGFVSYSVSHCMEMKDLLEAYDSVFDGARDDGELVAFLQAKAAATGYSNPKATFADIQANIEQNLLLTGISDAKKLDCNFPWEHMVQYMVHTVCDRPETLPSRPELLDTILRRSTAADGLSGEKGMSCYSSIALNTLTMFLAQESQADEGFLPRAITAHPRLLQSVRFILDCLCDGRWLPAVGDCGYAAYPPLVGGSDISRANKGCYAPVHLAEGIGHSGITLMGRLYKLTGDADYLRVAWHSCGGDVDGLPGDVNCTDVPGFRRLVAETVAREGAAFRFASANKPGWHLALLRAGDSMAWLTYDMRGADLHGHCDGLHLSLIAYGQMLLTDFGYPPVQYGGWFTEQSHWYAKPSAHNTVVVDGRDQVRNTDGRTLFWESDDRWTAIVLDGRDVAGVPQYERTTAIVPTPGGRCYLFDLFRVTGGQDHAFFLHGPFGTAELPGLALAPAPDYGHGSLLRDFRAADAVEPGWQAEWQVQDRYGLWDHPRDVHLRYTGLTDNASVSLCEAWVNAGSDNVKEEAWLPTLMVRRQSQGEPLRSAFLGVLEPFEGQSAIASVRRLPLAFADGLPPSPGDAAVEIVHCCGRVDVIVALETPGRTAVVQTGTGTLQTSKSVELFIIEPRNQ